MTDITIHVHMNDGEEPRAFTIAEEATIEDLLRKIAHEAHTDFFIVVEEECEPTKRHHKLRECGIQQGHHVHCHPHSIHYTVDSEPEETTRHKMTAYEIMKNAGVDPETHYLIRLKRDHEKESYNDNPQQPIHLHNCMEFITASLGPTRVS